MRGLFFALALTTLLGFTMIARADVAGADCAGSWIIDGNGGLRCSEPNILGDYPDASATMYRAGPDPTLAAPAPVARVRRVDTLTTGLVIGVLTLVGIAVVAWRIRTAPKQE